MLPSPRPCAVVRVSTDEQDLSQQLAEVRRWCVATLGVELADADVYREQGVSGWKNKTLASRPGLQAAVQGCLAGRYTHLIVHKVDRSSRNVALMAGVIDQLQSAGVIFASVMEALDTSQLGAAFVINLLLAFAQHFGNNLSAEVKKGKRHRRENGLPNGPMPYGAIAGADGVPVPDLRPFVVAGRETTRYAVLISLWERSAGGMNTGALTQAINLEGVRSVHNHLWSRASVRRILDNRFYLGEVRDGHGNWQRGAHAPLIPQALWDAVHRRLYLHAARPDRAKNGSAPRIFGRGVLRCVACRRAGRNSGMHVSQGWGDRYYICSTRGNFNMCTAPLVREQALEQQFLDLLRWEIDAAELAEAVERFTAQIHATQPDRAALTQRISQLTARLRRIAELYEMGEYSAATYQERRKATHAEIAHLEQDLHATPPQDRAALDRAIAVVRDLPGQWETLDTAGKAGIVREIFHALLIEDGRIVGMEPHDAYAALFAVLQPAMVGSIG